MFLVQVCLMSLLGIDFSIHSDGLKFVGILAGISVICLTFSTTIGWIFVFLTLFCAFFFRNPKRVIDNNPDLIVSPCDGTVCAINLETPNQDLELGDEPRYRVSIFLSLLNVHVNRVPFSGFIKNILYHPGSFLNASLDKASVFNEKNTVIISMKNDPEKTMAFTQIAGMLARRIVCDVHEGQEIKKGDIFGLIRFGSRCDVWLPVGVMPSVIRGQTMIAGESIVADISSTKKELATGEIV